MPAPDNLATQIPGQPQAAATTSTTTQGQEPEYTAKHNGGGRWRIWATSTDDWFSDFVVAGDGAKDLAQAEADRLNAGGAPFVKPVEPPAPAPAVQEQPQAAAAPAAPAQRQQPVLTDEGWLVP